MQKKALPFLSSTVDLDILLAIGLAQESGRPLGTTDLFHACFAPSATVSRRLRRLRSSGAVIERASPLDGRRKELRLNPAVSQSLRQLLNPRA